MPGTRISCRVVASLAAAALMVGSTVAGSARDRAGGPDRIRELVDARGGQELIGGDGTAAKARVDTIYLIGGPGQLSGKFELADHVTPDPQGWFGVDLTSHAIPRWQISPFNAVNLDPGRPGNNAMWCGETFAAGCGGDDVPEGYGNYYDDWLDWRGTVSNNAVATTVRVTAILNLDSEPNYDRLGFEVETATGMTSVGADLTGAYTGFVFDRTVSVSPANYVGAGHDEVHLRWRATSDTEYSDSDCQYPSSGFAQVDNVSVFFDGVLQTSDDFETGNPVHWVNAAPPAVGNFAKVWPRLFDLDACKENPSPQWAFIDDGVVVPGTGGSLGQSWTYGPGGFVVNTTGGLAGPSYGLHTEVWSPPIDWPVGCEGGSLRWDQYSDQKLDTGLIPVWHVRSSANGGVTWGLWDDDNTIYYGGGLWSPNYYRDVLDLRRYLVPGCNKVQIALGVWELWPLDYLGTDSTPAPYFDNVALLAWPIGGPTISAGEQYLFNDGWPEAATIDYADLAKDSVRLDMASNISPRAHLRNDPGDSIVVTVKPLRAGSVLNGRPELHVLMKANPLFDGVRTNVPAGFTRTGSLISGVVAGDTVRAGTPPTVKADLWKWDLPDTGFFFPGDMLHYYITAQDNQAGDIGTSYLPADTTGFSLFPGQRGYRSGRFYEAFKVDALPSMISATAGDQPHLLFWNDFQSSTNQGEWLLALDNLGYRQNIDYDIYCTNAPSIGVGNGLGGRTNTAKMSGYGTLLYSPAHLGAYTLSNGDFTKDPGNDIAVVDAWLSLGGRNMFATGDNIIENLSASGASAVAFRDKWFSVAYSGFDLRYVTGQASLRVNPLTAAGAPVLSRSYFVYGGCIIYAGRFDAVTATGTAVSIAEFTSPSGGTGVYPYAAAAYNYVAASTARVVLMPYDLQFIRNLGDNPGTRPVRADLLLDVLTFFGQLPGGLPVGVTPDAALTTRNYPNPFNPGTKIEFSLPRAGRVELRIYNVRGELVKTLLDQRLDAATHAVVWDGRDTRGQAVSSGVYFYSLKAGGDEKMVKMTLVK